MGNVITAIFCDDIRQEVNGKFILIGVYSGQLVVPQYPWTGGVASMIVAAKPITDVRSLSVRMCSQGGAVFGQIDLQFDPTPAAAGRPIPEETMINLAPLLISLSGTDTLELYASLNGEPEELAGRLQVLKAQT